MVDEQHLDAAAPQLVNQHHLMRVPAREPVGTQHVQAVDRAGGGGVAQLLQGWANQRRAADAVIDEAQLRLDDQLVLGGPRQHRVDLRLDRAGVGLVIAGDTRVQRRADAIVAVNGIALQHAHAPAATRAAAEGWAPEPLRRAGRLALSSDWRTWGKTCW